MTCTKVKRLVKPSLLMLGAVVLSLAAFGATTAKTRTYSAVKAAVTTGNFRSATINANAVKRALFRIIRDKAKTNPKFAKSLSAACSCAVAPNAAVGFGDCIKSCLADAGVSAVTLASCGAICSSGNLVGCAICAGVQEWIVLACAQYCAWRRVFNNTEARQLRPSKTHGLQQAKLLMGRAAVSS